MRLFHLLTTLDVGGAEMHVLTQVRGQRARGHEVRVAYLLGEGTLAPDFEATGATVVGCVGKGLGALPKLREHLAWCQIAHTHLLRADFIGAAAALLWGKRKRLVSGKHNDEQALRRPLVSFVHGLVGRVPTRTIVLSDHVGRFIAEHGRVPESRQERIYYGIDPEPWAAARAESLADSGAQRRAIRAEFGFGPDDLVLICVARFAPQKAHEILLQAFAEAREELAADGPVLRLLLVGDDPFFGYRPKAEAVANELGLIESGACVFAGIRRDVPKLIAASDVFTMASRWEGLGLVFLEAMAAGLPILSTKVSAIPEVVVDGETGRLVPADDAPALAAGMLELARDPGLRKRWGVAGVQRVAKVFGLDRMVDETLEVYRGVCGETRS
ncbi:MAG: glycosyltransferase involved in cell wall biosynthesis [Planctomycetota bacterium]|jgi:glycosyltransferase involved in cell wall biosynthesis